MVTPHDPTPTARPDDPSEGGGSRPQHAAGPRSLRRRLTLPFFRTLANGVRVFGERPPGRFLRNRLLSSIHYSKKGVQIADQSFGGLSIVFLTDLHAGHVLSADDLVRIVDRVNDEAPDVVCFGGDLVDTRPQDLHVLKRALGRLRPRIGSFAVPGNHEYQVFGTLDGYYRFLEENGVTPLHNRGVRLESGGSSIWLGGVDDATDGQPSVSAALEGREAGEQTVLLSHHPDVFPVAAKRGVDLQLSGHTHGGQISFLGWRPIVHSQRGYVQGVHWRGSSALYVSRGVGVTALPFRIGVSAEVSLFDLRPSTPEVRETWANESFDVLAPGGDVIVDAPGETVFLGIDEPPSALPSDAPERRPARRS